MTFDRAFFILKIMKNSIKIKFGLKLDRLINRVPEMNLLIRIAYYCDTKSLEAKKSKVNPNKVALDNLVLAGIIIEENGLLRLADKTIIEVTKKRKDQSKTKLGLRLLSEVQESEVPKSDLEYLIMAKAFQTLFHENITKIKGRTINIENGKYDKWVTPVRLMMTSDKVSLDEMREVYKFLDGHHFWMDKVQSTEKLRTKFQTLYNQFKKDGFKKGTPDDSARTVSSERKDYD